MSTDYASEEAITRRQKALVEIRPAAADSVYDATRWRREFVSHQVVETDSIDRAQREKHVLFCPACQEHRADGLSFVHKLHVVYEDDPLKNFPFLVRTTCHGCGFKEYLPPLMPEVTKEETDLIHRARKVASLMAPLRAAPSRNSGLLTHKTPPPYFIQIEQEQRWKPFDEVMERKREAALTASQMEELLAAEAAQMRQTKAAALQQIAGMQNQLGVYSVQSAWTDELARAMKNDINSSVLSNLAQAGLAAPTPQDTIKIKTAPPPKGVIQGLRDYLTKKDRNFK